MFSLVDVESVETVENIVPFNGVIIKVSGGGCLLNITGNPILGYDVTLGLVSPPTTPLSLPKIKASRYSLDGKLISETPLALTAFAGFADENKGLPTKNDTLKNDPGESVKSRLASFRYFPNFSTLYKTPSLGFNGDLFINWEKIPYKIEFQARGVFSTYNLATTQGLINVKFSSEEATKPLNFGNVGSNIAFLVEFLSPTQSIVYTDKKKILYSTDFLSNVYTLIEIESCFGEADPLSFYYDDIIWYTPSGATEPTPIRESGIYPIISGSMEETDNVYCSPLVTSGNRP